MTLEMKIAATVALAFLACVVGYGLVQTVRRWETMERSPERTRLGIMIILWVIGGLYLLVDLPLEIWNEQGLIQIIFGSGQ